MSTPGQREPATQNRVVEFFKNQNKYADLGNWQGRNGKCETEYLFQRFRMRKSFFIDTCTQSERPNCGGILATSFASATPSSLNEQTATVLSDMNKDLEAPQQRLHKTQQIKQGMMQALLMGKTRLA